MNQHLHSPTKLTEFARDFEEEPETLFGRFVNKIQNVYNQSYNTVNDVSSGTQISKSQFYADPAAQTNTNNSSNDNNSSTTSMVNAQNRSATSAASTSNANISRSTSEPGSNVSINSTTNTEESTNSESVEKIDEANNEGRTMVNVLKRISNIMAYKNSDLRNYKDTDLQRFWMPDSKAKECYDCSQKFSTFRRKHHCRLCGQIFCSKCCNQVVPGKIIMCSGDLKVCNYCSKIVLSYLKSPNIAVELHSDLQALQHDLTSKLELNDDTNTTSNILPIRPPQARKASLGYQEERLATYQTNSLSQDDRKNILQQSNSLITLHEEMQRSLPAQNCGTHLIEFLNANHKSSSKVQAIAILGAMLSAGFLQPIVPDSDQTEFDETLHYKFNELPRIALENLQFDETNSCSEVSSPQFEVSTDDFMIPKSIDTSLSLQSVLDLELENSMRWTSKLLESYCEHEEQLLTQMLRTYQLDLQWTKVLTQLCSRAANDFKPEFCSNDLWDIRNYVNFKKVPGGKRTECTIVGGVVFSKNVAHKDMATRVERPRILLLQCPIVYERIEGKFVSISTVLLQEKEYLRNVCARIMAFKPNVVIVHKNVAGIAQDMLRKHNVTLVLDVKYSVMERLARTLQCDILTSIESNIAKPRLGLCDVFYIKSFNDGSGSYKTLMFFEKLMSPRGFTCLLRGGSNKELAKVKRIAQFLLYARYNWRLEMSFLLDEFAQSVAPKPPIFDSKENSPNELEEDTALIRAPLPKRAIIERKSEDKILAAITENVTDCTDPLRSGAIDANESGNYEQNIVELAVENRYDNRFRNALSSTILSVSPFVAFPLPYLETEQGRKCALRSLFPPELYFSKLWSNSSFASERLESTEKPKTNIIDETLLNPVHPFLKLKITAPVDNKDIQTLLAEFRSYGGRFPKNNKLFKMLKKKDSYQRPQKLMDEQVYKDALDLENHQRLPVLFCSFYINPKSTSSFCAPPTLLDMKFYGQQDITLGQFLQRYCCVLTSICSLCKLPMLGHVRRYVHSMGCVQVSLTEDSMRTDPNRIYFTACCSICNAVTPTVPISDTTKRLSFAKYLELRFHGHAYKRRPLDESKAEETKLQCEHSIHRDYIHDFIYRGVRARFQYSAIEVWEIALPSLTLTLMPPKTFDRFSVLEDIKTYSMRGHEVYTRIHERIADLAIDDENSPLLTNLKTTLSKDQFIFKQHVEIIQTLLTDQKANAYDLNDAMLMSKRVLAESIDLWGPRLHDITLAQKAAVKQAHAIDAASICTEEIRVDHNDISPTSSEIPRLPASMTSTDGISQTEYISDDVDVSTASTILEKKHSVEQFVNNTDKKSIKKILTHLLPSTSHTNPLQSPFTSQEHYTLPLGSIPVLVHDSDLSSIVAYSLTCTDYQRLIAGLNVMSSTVIPHNNNSNSQGSESSSVNANVVQLSPSLKRKSQEGGLEGDESGSTTHKASNNTTNTATDDDRLKLKTCNSHIEITFHDHSTHFNCKIYFAKEFDLMRAKTLNPPKINKSLYKEYELSKKREEIVISQSKTGAEIELIRKPSDGNLPPYSNTNKPPTTDSNTKNDKQQLQNDIENCRSYLARSLCSSVQWEARGGKSGSRFCKTSDDRFVLKEMTKTDMSIFENFAPNYFEYISKCQQGNHPTLLAKIFGVFKVTIRKKDSFVEKSLLVMENLFYDCDIKSKFDLKGSERNRLVDPINQHGDEIVLLDENLVQMSWSKPLYILSHSKAVLKDAIKRDSSFLEKNQVMDYSLLVGLDNKNSVLVLGIIDYIRTFTFDKKVESFVKQSGLLGGMGKLPTVIPPERYKQRFTDAMDRYFYTVPDRWEGLSKT